MAEEIVPESTLTWVRTIDANRFATDGASWVDSFSANNSGTINNQWMVVDYNKFSPGKPLRDGTLTVLEQWPQFIQSADVTRYLRVGHWQSFNKPFFEEGYSRSGNVRPRARSLHDGYMTVTCGHVHARYLDPTPCPMSSTQVEHGRDRRSHTVFSHSS